LEKQNVILKKQVQCEDCLAHRITVALISLLWECLANKSTSRSSKTKNTLFVFAF